MAKLSGIHHFGRFELLDVEPHSQSDPRIRGMDRGAERPDGSDRMEERRVAPERLRWFCDPAELPFETTEELEPLDGAIGQERGVEALEFGLEIESPGFNLFVAGPSGVGKSTAARTCAERLAARRPVPDDWLYVYDFERPDHPLALSLPAGEGARFRDAMAELIKAVQEHARQTFDSREYRNLREEIQRKLEDQRRPLIEGLSRRAQKRGFAASFTPVGAVLVPLSGDKPMTSDDVERLFTSGPCKPSMKGSRYSPVQRPACDGPMEPGSQTR
jgi:hypothetical protein